MAAPTDSGGDNYSLFGTFSGGSRDVVKGGEGADDMDGGPKRDSCKGGPGTPDTALNCENTTGVP